MEGAIHRLVRLCRLSGMRISVSETLDAMRVAALPGLLEDRELLRDALAVALVKDRRDLPMFDRVFEAFFRLRRVHSTDADIDGHTHDGLDGGADIDDVAIGDEPGRNTDHGHPDGKPTDIRDFFDPEDLAEQYNLHQEANRIDLAALSDEIVLSNDQTAMMGEAARVELSISRLQGAARAGDLVAGDRPAIDAMLSIAEEMALLDWLAEEVGSDDDLDPIELARMRRRIGALLDGLPDRIRHHLQALLALEDRRIESPGLATLDKQDPVDEAQRADLEESLRRLVRTLHGAPHARRRISAAGRVDGGRTMRKSMAYDGVPFRPITVSRPYDRPRLVVLVDVSLSVRATSRFTLNVVHGLQSLVAQVRSWVFVADVVETTDVFAERHADEALTLLSTGLPAGGLLDVDADSDYGSVFGSFLENHGTALNRRTTLIVLGDGRGNGHNPNVEAFREMTRRVRETIWLTPEPSYSWRLGRCDLPLYSEYCSRVQVVRDLSGLSRLDRAR